MNNARLKQIKIFKLSDYFSKNDLENDYVVKIFKEQGNYPNIETNSQFISVITDCLIKIENN